MHVMRTAPNLVPVSISRVHAPTDEAYRAAALLGRYVATQTEADRAELQAIIGQWPAATFRSWLVHLQTDPALIAAQYAGFGEAGRVS